MQKKNREGFTLIELLAVIVILAIIALIAVPVIMNVITKARKSAFEDSAYGIVKAGEMYYTNKLLDTEGMTGDKEFIISNGAFEGDALDVSGSLPSSGKVTVTSDGKVALAISNGEYCIRKATTESKVEAEPLEDLGNVCDYKKVANPVFTTSTSNASIPACIKDNIPCDVSAAGDDGIGVAVKVNASETYDFYVMSEDASKGTITLIMNQNLGETVAWITEEDYYKVGGIESDWYWSDIFSGSSDKGPVTALNYLENQTLNWTNIPSNTYILKGSNNFQSPLTRTNVRARLITYNEATELGCEVNTTDSCPKWLYVNGAYYLSTDDFNGASDYAPLINGDSIYFADYVAYDNYYGIRPVITISKTII